MTFHYIALLLYLSFMPNADKPVSYQGPVTKSIQQESKLYLVKLQVLIQI